MDKLTYVLLLSLLTKCVLCSKSNDECFLLPSQKMCNMYLTRLAWYYDPSVHECKQFVYYGCDNASNLYETQDACYAKCSEKLLTLHPAWNLRVIVMRHNSAALIWYPPSNYVLHTQFENQSNADNQTGEYKTVNQSSTASGDGLLHHVVLHKPEQGASIINNLTYGVSDVQGTNGTDSNRTDSDSDKNVPITKSTTNTSDENKQISTTTISSVIEGQTTDSNQNQINKTASDSNIAPDDKSTTPAPEATSTPKAAPTPEATSTPEATPPGPVEDLENGGRNLSIKDYVGSVIVPFHYARLTKYVISYKAVRWTQWKNITVAENTSYYNLTGLTASTAYLVKVSAVYHTNTSLPTPVVQFKTQEHPSEANKCYCDKYGTIGGERGCNQSLRQLPWCECKPGHGGLFCETCARGYYRIGPTRTCHKCPCTLESSTGSCHFVDGYLHCLKCHEAYAGILCHRCGNGYYRDYSTNTATCKKCEGCHNIKPGLICDPYTGKCLNCHYNTTGEQCDKCLPGFEGDPLKNIQCDPTAAKGKFKPPASGVIASIVVGVIVLLSGIVGIIVYRRIQRSPVNKPFWTIEFQEDHEGVNFSSVPNDDADRNVEDLKFYEDVQKSSSKSQPYSRLHEDL